MSKGGGGVSGYRYYFDILMGIGRGPIDELVEIKVGDIEVWPGQNTSGGQSDSVISTDIATMQSLFNPGARYPTGGFSTTGPTPVIGNQFFSINSPNAFGGDTAEGGILGNCTMMMGATDQVVPDNVKNSIATGTTGYAYTYIGSGSVGSATDAGTIDPTTGQIIYDTSGDDLGTVEQYADISDFRGVATLFYSGLICSNNPYPKIWKLRVRRALQGWDANGCWYPAKVIIQYNAGTETEIRAMNPAHMLYQCITDQLWGRGMDRAEMDDASWTYAANYLYDEGFGLCLKWSKEGSLDDFIQTIVDHIGGVVYVDRGTGLLCLRLVRNDYTYANVPVFSYSTGLLSVESVETGSGTVTANEVIVAYHDPILDQDRQTRVQNLASIQSLNSVISTTKQYPGIPDPDLARRAALRELKLGSAGLKRFKIKLDRRAWKLQPGSVLRLNAPDRGIVDICVRVATYDDGTAVDGTITMDVMQDVFDFPGTTFTTEPTATWTGPQSGSAPVLTNRKLYEASYYDMARILSAADFAAVDATEGGLVAVAQTPVGNALSTVLLVTPSGGTAAVGPTGIFCPTGFLALPMDYYTTTLQLSGGTILSAIKPGDAALIDDEIVRITSVDLTAGTVVLARGCADTIPAPHIATSIIFFSNATKSAHTAEYTIGETIGVQILSRTTTNVLDPALAPLMSATIFGRHNLPYPPSNVMLNGVPALVDAGIAVSGDAVLTWGTRNRVTQFDQLVSHFEGDVAAESGTTYTVQVWDHNANALLRAHSGITSQTFTYAASEATANSDPPAIDLKLFAVNGSQSSYQVYRIYMRRVGSGGYGHSYGYDYSVS